MRIDEALARAEALAGCSDSPQTDVQLLLETVLGCNRAYLFTWPERHLSDAQQRDFEKLLARRRAGEPVAHILGLWDFWTLTLEVNASTLIPRSDTELLVELGLEKGPDGPARVADLGTGTGAIALALASERPAWEVTAVEQNPEALALAERNRQRLELDNVALNGGSWCEPLTGHYALILSNPPYIDPEDPHLGQGDVRFEPRGALVAEAQGLADLATIADQARRYLDADGWLLLEHGYNQGAAVRGLLAELGYRQVASHRDLGDQERVTLGQWSMSLDE